MKLDQCRNRGDGGTELAASIAKSAASLPRQKDIVQGAVADAGTTNEDIAALAAPRPKIATWSSSSRILPDRPTCWRSMPRSKRRVPARPDAALLSLLPSQSLRCTDLQGN